IATLLLGALVFAWLDRWRKRSRRDDASPADLLTSFRSSYEQGELSQEEYERIRARLAPKIKQQLGAADKSAAPERPRPTDTGPGVSQNGDAGPHGIGG